MTGDRVGTKQEDGLKSHQHGIKVRGNSTLNGPFVENTLDSAIVDTAESEETGGNETRPKNIYMMFIIKVWEITFWRKKLYGKGINYENT